MSWKKDHQKQSESWWNVHLLDLNLIKDNLNLDDLEEVGIAPKVTHFIKILLNLRCLTLIILKETSPYKDWKWKREQRRRAQEAAAATASKRKENKASFA